MKTEKYENPTGIFLNLEDGSTSEVIEKSYSGTISYIQYLEQGKEFQSDSYLFEINEIPDRTFHISRKEILESKNIKNLDYIIKEFSSGNLLKEGDEINIVEYNYFSTELYVNGEILINRILSKDVKEDIEKLEDVLREMERNDTGIAKIIRERTK